MGLSHRPWPCTATAHMMCTACWCGSYRLAASQMATAWQHCAAVTASGPLNNQTVLLAVITRGQQRSTTKTTVSNVLACRMAPACDQHGRQAIHSPGGRVCHRHDAQRSLQQNKKCVIACKSPQASQHRVSWFFISCCSSPMQHQQQQHCQLRQQ